MKIISLVVFLMATSNVFAQEAPQKQTTVHVKATKEGGTYTYPAPGPGENLTVIVDQPPAKKAAPAPAPVTNAVSQKSDLRLRGGLGVSTVYGGLTKNLASTVGILGGIGYTDSPWQLRGRFNVGKCHGDTVAIGGNLAAMRRVRGSFWVGAGADLLYCSDVKSHPTEQTVKRYVGGSARVAYERDHFLFEEFIGVTEVTFPIPGGRVSHPSVVGGFSASYVF